MLSEDTEMLSAETNGGRVIKNNTSLLWNLKP